MMGLTPYPAYKDSGVTWLGEVPGHWEVMPALAVYKPKLRRNVGMVERTVLSLSYGRIVVKPDEKLHGLVPESFETYQIVDPGNIVVRTTDLQNDKTSLRIGHSKNRGIITAAYMCLETTGLVLNDFGYQVLNAYDLLKIIYGYGSGLRQNLDFSDIKRMPVAVPPLPEQAALVGFLDHVDRRIRRYIRAKQELITLLEEQKQAIIHRAVTRGLDPTARLRPSGVEWLGDVPEQWEIRKLKQLTRFRNGLAFKPGDWSATGVPIIRIQNLNGSNEFNYTLRRNFPESLRIGRGDLLFSWSGNRGTSFGPFIWDREFEGYLNQHIFKLDGYSLHRQYFAHLLRAVTRHVEEQTHGIIGLVHITKPDLGAVRVPVPSPEEQAAIAGAIDKQLAGLEALIKPARREIALLIEYRMRLVADIVTGRLDVREAAARLPDEIHDPAQLDEINALGDEGEEGDDPEPDIGSEEADP